MIVVEKAHIGEIPFLHIVEQENYDAKLPFIIFVHGFTSIKERNLHYAYFMAEKGFRVVLPECLGHGERKTTDSKTELNLRFWDIVINTIEELTSVKDYFIKKGNIDSERIGLAGTSMGAIITLGAITQYDWVKVAVSLMGTPSYIEFANYQLEQLDKYGMSVRISEEEKEKILFHLRPYDLSLQPEKLAKRPLFFWHGQMDPEVPFLPAYQFYEKIKAGYEHESDKLQFVLAKKAGHSVPHNGVRKTVEWFEKFL